MEFLIGQFVLEIPDTTRRCGLRPVRKQRSDKENRASLFLDHDPHFTSGTSVRR
jgi:hypothetical protein